MHKLFLLSVLVYAAGCANDEEVDQAGADALWAKLQNVAYRTTFEPAPGWETPQPTIGAHGRTAVILMNPTLADALASGPLPAWPEGTLIVKDSYDAENLTLIAAMEKQGGAWFYAEWSAGGAVKYAGTPSVCTGCHVAANDRLRAVTLPN